LVGHESQRHASKQKRRDEQQYRLLNQGEAGLH
jgi:hypothetical protein